MSEAVIQKSSYVRTIGFAMFSMFFGAGNVIFPLLLGRTAGDQINWAMLGMFLTAIVVPFTGVLSMVRFGADYKKYFARVGKIPGALMIFLILCLIGPFGGIPRCVALSHSTLELSFPGLPLGLFGLAACAVIFLFTAKKQKIVALLGNVLTPILLVWLLAIIVAGFFADTSDLASTIPSSGTAFVTGFFEGYNTLDLLAAFFFSSIVFNALPSTNRGGTLLRSTLLAGGLLTLIYGGLAYISATHATQLAHIPPDQLLGALAHHLLGGWAGLFANVTVALACLTTAITLASIFSDILSREVFRGKLGYVPCLILTLVVAYFVSYLRVTGIVRLIAPILWWAYPVLIALSLFNLIRPLAKKADSAV